jgi:D-tagatose-1,6-bisphosphate aldolase subunit GatZ/KbaZ
MKIHPLQKLLHYHKKCNRHTGIYSVCSANPHVIETAIQFAKQQNSYVLIESTSNQVDQYGGYTGMKPEDFRMYVHNKAEEAGLAVEKLILGGDHLGPNVWQNESSASAMEKAAVQIKAYIEAGFTKIHLDTSIPCKDDELPLANELVAERAAFLCRVAEETNSKKSTANPLVYIIGSEVPVPGGAQEQLDELAVTKPDDVREQMTYVK